MDLGYIWSSSQSEKVMKIDVNQEVVSAVKAAVNHAIRTVGWNGFLATSMFPSSRRTKIKQKLAA
jgi:hypothetical protein